MTIYRPPTKTCIVQMINYGAPAANYSELYQSISRRGTVYSRPGEIYSHHGTTCIQLSLIYSQLGAISCTVKRFLMATQGYTISKSLSNWFAKKMKAHRISDWQFWNALNCARIPIRLLLEPERIATRSQMKEISASAYVYRMFELFAYNLRDPQIAERLRAEERRDLEAFHSAFDALSWQPLASHPHISELVDDNYSVLVQPAKRLDRHLWLRTDSGPVPVIYRLLHGWPLFEASLKAKEEAD